VHSGEEDVTVISESEAWWKYGHLLDVVYIVVVVIFVIRVRVYYSLPRNGFIKTGNYYGMYIPIYNNMYVSLLHCRIYMRVSDLNRSLHKKHINIVT